MPGMRTDGSGCGSRSRRDRARTRRVRVRARVRPRRRRRISRPSREKRCVLMTESRSSVRGGRPRSAGTLRFPVPVTRGIYQTEGTPVASAGKHERVMPALDAPTRPRSSRGRVTRTCDVRIPAREPRVRGRWRGNRAAARPRGSAASARPLASVRSGLRARGSGRPLGGEWA